MPKIEGWKLARGCVYQKISVTASAEDSATQAYVHHRISARGTERRSAAKNTAIMMTDAASAEMLQRHSNNCTVFRWYREPLEFLRPSASARCSVSRAGSR